MTLNNLKFYKKILTVLFVLSLLNLIFAQGIDSKTAQIVDKLFKKWDRKDSPGCAIGVIHNGKLIYKHGYGMANLEYNIPNSSNSVFRIGSTSKQFTAACMVLLEEQGKLSLDDNIRKYLPEIPVYGKTITINHLLHHTSGIRDYLQLAYLKGLRDDDFYTDDEVVEWLSRQKSLNFLPGEEYLYSNSGYFLLSQIVKRVAGKSMKEYADEYIFKPLGMNNTHFHDNHTEIVKNRASGYSPAGEGKFRICMTTLGMIGDGGIFTTVEDIFKWDRNFYISKIGGDKFIGKMLKRGRFNSGKEQNYASGLIHGEYGGLKTIRHGGAFVGFRADILRFPEEKFTVICLANLSNINPSLLCNKAAEIFLGDKMTLPEKAPEPEKPVFVEIDTGLYEKYVGKYLFDRGFTVSISKEKDKLTAEYFGEKSEVLSVSEIKFYVKGNESYITFQKNSEGVFNRIVLHFGGRELIGNRLEPYKPSMEELHRYSGDYYSDELDVIYTFFTEGENLYLKFKNNLRLDCDFLKKNEVLIEEIGKAVFDTDNRNNVKDFILEAGRVKNLKFVKQ